MMEEAPNTKDKKGQRDLSRAHVSEEMPGLGNYNRRSRACIRLSRDDL